MGYLPEHDCLPPDVSASDFVVHLAMMSGLPRIAARERAAEVLRHVGLAEERYRPMGGYSTGMKQRAKLAQALAHDPHWCCSTNRRTASIRPRVTACSRWCNASGRTSGSLLSSPHTCWASWSASATTSWSWTADDCCVRRGTGDFLDATGTLLVEVLGDEAQDRMGQALAAAGVAVPPARWTDRHRAVACRRTH